MNNSTLYDKAKAKGYSKNLCRFLHAKEKENELYGNGAMMMPCVIIDLLFNAIDRGMDETSLVKIALCDMRPCFHADVNLPGVDDMTTWEIESNVEEGTPEYEKMLSADKTFDYERAFAQLKEKYPDMRF